MSQSTEENSKDESENRSKSIADAKPSKDRRNRKDKVKPLAKVNGVFMKTEMMLKLNQCRKSKPC